MLAILDVDSAVDGLSALHNMSHDDNMVPALGVLVGLAAVVLLFLTPILIVASVLRHRSRQQSLVNDVVLKLAEKGHPIPPELFIEQVRQKSDFRRGIMSGAVGLGLICAGGFWDNSFMLGVGFIPLMMGVGFVVATWLENKQKQR